MARKFGNVGFGQGLLAAAALGGFLLFAGAPRVRADEHECQERVAKADHRLHEAVEHHGWESKQAEHWRHELAEARAWGWEHHHHWWDDQRVLTALHYC